MLKTGLDRASIVGKLGYWTSRASEIRRQHPLSSQRVIVASMFVNKTKTTLRAHTVDKNTSSVCRSKRRFRPKPHVPVLFLSIYHDTVPLKELGHHISDHDAINSTAILFLPYKEAISLDYCQFTGLWVQ